MSITLTDGLNFQVIDSILIADRKTRYYQGVMMAMEEWDAVEELCNVLKVRKDFLPTSYVY